MAGEGWVRPALSLPCAPSHGGHERLPRLQGPVSGAEVREARVAANHNGLYAPFGSGTLGERPRTELLNRLRCKGSPAECASRIAYARPLLWSPPPPVTACISSADPTYNR